MIKELGWYIESGRYSGIAEELDNAIRTYAEERSSDRYESVRELYEKHAVSCGLREKGNEFINIDAEFFEGKVLQEENVNTFIKDVIKKYCYQKILWEYMGTTGSLTQISKTEMENNGQVYEKYLPLGYKEDKSAAAAATTGKDETADNGEPSVAVYVYGDGSVSEKYDKEKGKLRFDCLQDISGFDWKSGYDANGEVKKEDWYGAFNEEESWVKVNRKEKKEESGSVTESERAVIELYKTEEGVILYDPGMILLNGAELVYLLEDGSEYGRERSDTEKTVEKIREALEAMGEKRISAVSTVRVAKSETASAGVYSLRTKESETTVCEEYRKVLGVLAAEKFAVKSAEELRNAVRIAEKAAGERQSERKAIDLERMIRVITSKGIRGKAAAESLASGKAVVELNVTEKADAVRLGLTEREYEAAAAYAKQLRGKDKEVYEKALTNLFSAWETYGSTGMEKAELAEAVYESLCSGHTVGGNTENAEDAAATETAKSETAEDVAGKAGTADAESAEAEAVAAAEPSERTGAQIVSIETTFREIAVGSGMLPVKGAGSAGDFEAKEPDVLYGSEAETYLKRLEDTGAIPVNAGNTIRERLEYIKEIHKEESLIVKTNINRALARVLSVYADISASMGMTVKEILETAAVLAGGKSGEVRTFVPPVNGYVSMAAGNNTLKDLVNKRIFFERSIEELIEAGNSHALPEKETEAEQLIKGEKTELVLIAGGKGGVSAYELLYGNGGSERGISAEMSAILEMLTVAETNALIENTYTAAVNTNTNTDVTASAKSAVCEGIAETDRYIAEREQKERSLQGDQTRQAERARTLERVKMRLQEIVKQVERGSDRNGSVVARFYEAVEKDRELAEYVGYNLSNEIGLRSYLASPRFSASGLSEEEVRTLSGELDVKSVPAQMKRIEASYRGENAAVKIEKKAGKGKLEKIASASLLPRVPAEGIISTEGLGVKAAAGVPYIERGFSADSFNLEEGERTGGYSSAGAESGESKIGVYQCGRESEEVMGNSESLGAETVHAAGDMGGALQPIVVFGGNEGKAVSELSGLSARKMEKEYGYNKSESRKVMQYLESIRIPAAAEKRAQQQAVREIRNAVESSKDTREVREKIAEYIGKRKDVRYNVESGRGRQAYEAAVKIHGLEGMPRESGSEPIPTHGNRRTSVSESIIERQTERSANGESGEKQKAGSGLERIGVSVGADGNAVAVEMSESGTTSSSYRTASVQETRGAGSKTHASNDESKDGESGVLQDGHVVTAPIEASGKIAVSGQHGRLSDSVRKQTGTESAGYRGQSGSARFIDSVSANTGNRNVNYGTSRSDSSVQRAVLPSDTGAPVVPVSFGKELSARGKAERSVKGMASDTTAAVEYESGLESAVESLSSSIEGKQPSDATAGQELNTRGKGSTAPASGSTRSVFGTGTHKTGTAVKGSTESRESTAAGNSAVSESEKLKRIIANYEKDKAEQAKKQPALARSATHEVGHAEGNNSVNKQGDKPEKIGSAIVDMICNQVKAGIL